MDALVAILAHQQVLALVRLGGTLVTDNAGLALVTDPAVLLIVVDQLGGVDPAAGVDTLATAVARHQVLHLPGSIAGLRPETLRADGDHGRFLERRTLIIISLSTINKSIRGVEWIRFQMTEYSCV